MRLVGTKEVPKYITNKPYNHALVVVLCITQWIRKKPPWLQGILHTLFHENTQIATQIYRWNNSHLVIV